MATKSMDPFYTPIYPHGDIRVSAMKNVDNEVVNGVINANSTYNYTPSQNQYDIDEEIFNGSSQISTPIQNFGNKVADAALTYGKLVVNYEVGLFKGLWDSTYIIRHPIQTWKAVVDLAKEVREENPVLYLTNPVTATAYTAGKKVVASNIERWQDGDIYDHAEQIGEVVGGLAGDIALAKGVGLGIKAFKNVPKVGKRIDIDTEIVNKNSLPEGMSKKVVIGENMYRVEKFAEQIGAETYKGLPNYKVLEKTMSEKELNNIGYSNCSDRPNKFWHIKKSKRAIIHVNKIISC